MPAQRNKKNLNNFSFLARIRLQYQEMVHDGFSEPFLLATMLALGLVMVLLAIKT